MHKQTNILAAALLLATGLTGCTIIPDAPVVSGTPVPQGTPVALGQAVRLGPIVATPVKIVEDSRCPINARCVWAGRLIVETRIDGAGWRDTADLTLGETYSAHELVIALTSGEPGRTTQSEIEPGDYRFTYELR